MFEVKVPDRIQAMRLEVRDLGHLTMQKVLAAASGGGHWIELLRLAPALVETDLHYMTVNRGYRLQVPEAGFYCVRDATQWSRLDLFICAFQVLLVIIRLRPDIVISTGAAPGFFALRFGKLFGAKTIWLDSIANVDELSRAGQMAGKFADLWLTQWPDLCTVDGPEYAGTVL